MTTQPTGVTRIIKQEINLCNDCPHCQAYSMDCVASAYCAKSNRNLPADGKDGTEIMVMEIPDWCELDIKTK